MRSEDGSVLTGECYMKPKAKTIQERLGFQDDELATPKHDEIMLWVDENIESVLSELLPEHWTEREIRSHQEQVERARATWRERCISGQGVGAEDARNLTLLTAEKQHWKLNGNAHKVSECESRLDAYFHAMAQKFPDPGPVPSRPPWQVRGKKWELPIRSGSYVVGVVDFCVFLDMGSVWLDGIEDKALFRTAWKISRDRGTLLFEIKPAIRSLGELIRQINIYRTYEQESRFVVVSPDDRFRSNLESQGISFVKYSV
jgi:hypothetical protein